MCQSFILTNTDSKIFSSTIKCNNYNSRRLNSRHISSIDKNKRFFYQSKIKSCSSPNIKKYKESMSILTEFPGEDAPGTGHRQFPKAHETNVSGISKHLMRSTLEYYEAFPLLIHTSCPINVSEVKTMSSRKILKTLPDAGPLSGHRKRPENIERFGSGHPVPCDPLPISKNTISYRRKQVKMRNMHL